jgi:hypothetical protein
VPPLFTQSCVAPLQTLPQTPQALAVVRSASQPLLGLPSQSPKPPLHEGAHTLLVALHEVVPCEFEHTSPQAEQFVGVPSGVSQPFAVLPSQLAKPAAHPTNAQLPVEHDAVAFGSEQGVLQSPQSVSVRMLRSQPLSRFESQLLKPALHEGEHAYEPGEPVQVFVPFCATQASPQAAQLLLVPSWVSHPALALQSAKPLLQPVSTQAPVAQEALPCGAVHGVPQPPQSVAVLRGVSQPLSGLPSQLA